MKVSPIHPQMSSSSAASTVLEYCGGGAGQMRRAGRERTWKGYRPAQYTQMELWGPPPCKQRVSTGYPSPTWTGNTYSPCTLLWYGSMEP